MDGIEISAISGIIVILALMFYNKTEGFASEIASIGSMPSNNSGPESGLSLFMNLHKQFGSDFKLFEFIQKLKLNNSDPVWNGVYSKGGHTRNLFKSKKLPPIILVPGLGATPIFARWNKSTSQGIKSIDESDNFETGDAWACKQIQSSWTQLWEPDVEGIASYCWADNVKVAPSSDNKKIVNASGVNTTIQDFGSLDFTGEYMDNLIESLEAVGYKKGENLFGACYDFRKIGSQDEIDAWCFSLTKLIEKNSALQENQAIIIGHDLGSTIANYFLVNAVPEWKNKYIKSFVTISGVFGGCPKALRAILSGVSAPANSLNFSDAVRNFSGLHLMLPHPNIYGDNPLVHFNQVSYSSYDIEKLINTVSEEAAKIYKIVKPIREKSMKAPGVTTYILAGDDLNTESSYKYNMSLVNSPQRNAPFYQLELPFNQKFNYPDYFVGDGTCPKFALEYPIWWTKTQQNPVYFQFFAGQEHSKILSSYEPIKYILSIL